MENVVDALKIVLAIFIFSIGIMLLFNMTSKAKETARILIAETDTTKYYNYYDDPKESVIDNNGNRIVKLKDIIPSLYRYSQENFGVTIVNKAGDIVARFDLDTERACNNWENVDMSAETKSKFIKETAKTFAKANQLAEQLDPKGNTINFYNDLVSVNKKSNGDIEYTTGEELLTEEKMKEMTDLFAKLYSQEKTNLATRDYYCFWVGNTGWTSQRVDSDLSRNRCIL